ncbi:sodium:proton antiporter [Candidatus Liberibacter brunswickensis]
MTTIIWGFVLAFIFGAIANRCRLPTLVGYLVAGILVGPRTPGFVASQSLVPALAEIGIILLMFGVGLHFSVKDLISVRGVALPGAIIQIVLGTALGALLGLAMGWSLGGSVVFGLALSIASTVVLLKALQENRILETERGKIAVGWLIVEDLVIVLALVFIPADAHYSTNLPAETHPWTFISLVSQVLGFELGFLGLIFITILKVVAFIGVMLIFGRRVIPWILHKIFYTGSKELFRLAVLAIALGFAYGSSKLFGVSLSLGAFFAGMILAESELSQNAAQESLPLRDAFSVLFFISVGMMFNPDILISHPILLIMAVLIVILGKAVIAFIVVISFGRSVPTALTIAASLSQIGEFSFILASLGVEMGILPVQARDIILASSIISIILNPLVFVLAGSLQSFLVLRFARIADNSFTENVSHTYIERDTKKEVTVEKVLDKKEFIMQKTDLCDHAVLVGYGRIGKIIVQNLKAGGIPLLVIEESEKRIEEVRSLDIDVIYGNATLPQVLSMANIEAARSLIISIPTAFESAYVAQEARNLNSSILIIAIADSASEVEHLNRYGADTVVIIAKEIAFGMLDRLNQVHHGKITYDKCNNDDDINIEDNSATEKIDS